MISLLSILNLPEWWSGFDVTEQIFYAIALLAGLVIGVLALLAVFGMDHEHLDSAAAGDAGDGTSLLSLKPILGFLLGFGWAGGAARSAGFTLPLSCVVAIGAGAVAMGCIYLLIRFTSRLKSDGTLKTANAVGQIGTVYINIPGGSAAGGQITVNIGDRSIVLQARHAGPATLPSGTKVRVVEFLGTDTVRVAILD